VRVRVQASVLAVLANRLWAVAKFSVPEKRNYFEPIILPCVIKNGIVELEKITKTC
jgi:hypothetical protein